MSLSKKKIHKFNLDTLIIDKEISESFDRQINLFLLPKEVKENKIVAVQWHTALDEQVCFPKNTQIETPNGRRNIQSLKEGELVLTHLGWRKIEKTIKRKYFGKMIKIKISNGTYLIATKEHPIFEVGRGWTEIQKLRRNSRLKTSKNKIVNIIGIHNIRFFKSYNFISKIFKFFIFFNIFQGVMPVISISFKTYIRIWKKKIDAISLNLKFLNKIYFQFSKSIPDFPFQRSFTRIFAIARKRTESFIIFLIRTNSKFFSTIKTLNICRWSSAFFRTIMIRSVVIIKDFAASFTNAVCYSGESALFATNSISGSIRLSNRENLSTNRTNFSYPLILQKSLITFYRTKCYSLFGFNFPRGSIKGLSTDFADKIFSPLPFLQRIMMAFLRAMRMSSTRILSMKTLSALFADIDWSFFYPRFMITLLRTIFLVRATEGLKFIFAKFTFHLNPIKQYYNRFASFCQVFNVYNLEVEDAHTFFANGILVHNCPLCASLQGQVFPVESAEFGRLDPPIHLLCRCMLSYITGGERGVEERIKEYQPIDPELLQKWSSKLYTKEEIQEMAKQLKIAEEIEEEI